MSSWALRYPDLAAAYSAGTNTGANIMQGVQARQERQQMRAEDKRRYEAQQAAQQQQASQGKELQDLQSAHRIMGNILSIGDPANQEAYKRSAFEALRRDKPDWNIPDDMSIDQIRQMHDQVGGMLQDRGVGPMVSDASAKARQAIADQLQRPELAAPGAIERFNDPEANRLLGEYTKASSGIETLDDKLARERAKKPLVDIGGINVSGNQAIEKGTKAALEKDAIEMEESLMSYDEQLAIPDEMFGAVGAGVSSLGKAADWLGVPADDTIAFTAAREAAFTSARKSNIQRLNRISGASVSEGERRNFEDVFANPDKFGPNVYKAKVRELRRLEEKDLALNRKQRGQGLAVDTGSAQDPARPIPPLSPERRQRILDLKNQGLTPEQVRAQLSKEGKL